VQQATAPTVVQRQGEDAIEAGVNVARYVQERYGAEEEVLRQIKSLNFVGLERVSTVLATYDGRIKDIAAHAAGDFAMTMAVVALVTTVGGPVAGLFAVGAAASMSKSIDDRMDTGIQDIKIAARKAIVAELVSIKSTSTKTVAPNHAAHMGVAL
jgi:hypothetical protein